MFENHNQWERMSSKPRVSRFEKKIKEDIWHMFCAKQPNIGNKEELKIVFKIHLVCWSPFGELFWESVSDDFQEI